MNNNSEGKEIKEHVRDGYRWTEQDCPICEIKPKNFVGRRGGHHIGRVLELKPIFGPALIVAWYFRIQCRFR